MEPKPTVESLASCIIGFMRNNGITSLKIYDPKWDNMLGYVALRFEKKTDNGVTYMEISLKEDNETE